MGVVLTSSVEGAPWRQAVHLLWPIWQNRQWKSIHETQTKAFCRISYNSNRNFLLFIVPLQCLLKTVATATLHGCRGECGNLHYTAQTSGCSKNVLAGVTNYLKHNVASLSAVLKQYGSNSPGCITLIIHSWSLGRSLIDRSIFLWIHFKMSSGWLRGKIRVHSHLLQEL